MQRVFLRNGIKAEDLEKGVEFEVDSHENEESGDSEDFNDERFDNFRDNLKEPDFKTTQLDIPFSELKPLMTPVTEDGLVRKQTLQCGIGVPIPDKSVVVMHYDAFLENQKLPYDSTRQRDRPYKFLFGDKNIIPALEQAIQTMRKEEIARVFVPSEYAFGEMGCPPRIPPNADIVYVVEIVNFFDSKDAIEFDEMTPDEQKKAPFEKVVAVFHCEHSMANDLFRSKKYIPAIARYRKMARILEDISVANEEQDEQRNGYLLKLYLNLCLCYTKIQNSQKAIIYGKLGLGLNETNPKAMFRLGCAFVLADDYDNAQFYLLKAREHKPFTASVQKVLLDLERKRKEHRDWENIFYKKMFSMNITPKEAANDTPEANEFRTVLREQFKKFLESNEEELSFSCGYNDWQIDIVKELSNEFNLAFVSKIHYDDKIIKVVKSK